MDHQAIIAHTRRWIASIVIGLNLCPFAQRVFREDRIRYVVTDARDQTELLQVLSGELQRLVAIPREDVETVLLIHPQALANYLDHNDFLTPAEALVKKLGLQGTI